MRVTFDTNQIDAASRPGPTAPASHHKVRDALKVGSIEGFFSETVVTLEGLKRADRAEVIASTKLVLQPERLAMTNNADLPAAVRAMVGDRDLETVALEMRVEQARPETLPTAFAARIKAAFDVGMRVLRAVPRLGAPGLAPTSNASLPNDDNGQLRDWLAKVHEVARLIEERGLGYAQAKALGDSFRVAGSAQGMPWFRALTAAADVHQKRAVQRAFGEWADGDSIASHVAYGLDVFCTADKGNSNGAPSILDSVNRQWLADTYGVRFMTIGELADQLS